MHTHIHIIAFQLRNPERELITRKDFHNCDDLLRKLWWNAKLIEPILRWSPNDKYKLEPLDNLFAKLKELHELRNLNTRKNDQKIPGLPLTDLIMGVCYDSRPWTTFEEFGRELQAHPLNAVVTAMESYWDEFPKYYTHLPSTLAARLVRTPSGQQFLVLGSTAEKWPQPEDGQRGFWGPVHDWCQETRRNRLGPDMLQAYDFLHQAFQIPLHNAVNARPGHDPTKRPPRMAEDIAPKAVRSSIQRTRKLMLSPFPDGDVAFSMIVKSMEPKDACHRCYAHRFSGTVTLYQRDLEISIKDSNFRKLFPADSCAEIVTNTMAVSG
ncbi:MAG: hypothetical protein Q9211_001250 [Gyalolechia sp. 1 TL-2023]